MLKNIPIPYGMVIESLNPFVIGAKSDITLCTATASDLRIYLRVSSSSYPGFVAIDVVKRSLASSEKLYITGMATITITTVDTIGSDGSGHSVVIRLGATTTLHIPFVYSDGPNPITEILIYWRQPFYHPTGSVGGGVSLDRCCLRELKVTFPQGTQSTLSSTPYRVYTPCRVSGTPDAFPSEVYSIGAFGLFDNVGEVSLTIGLQSYDVYWSYYFDSAKNRQCFVSTNHPHLNALVVSRDGSISATMYSCIPVFHAGTVCITSKMDQGYKAGSLYTYEFGKLIWILNTYNALIGRLIGRFIGLSGGSGTAANWVDIRNGKDVTIYVYLTFKLLGQLCVAYITLVVNGESTTIRYDSAPAVLTLSDGSTVYYVPTAGWTKLCILCTPTVYVKLHGWFNFVYRKLTTDHYRYVFHRQAYVSLQGSSATLMDNVDLLLQYDLDTKLYTINGLQVHLLTTYIAYPYSPPYPGDIAALLPNLNVPISISGGPSDGYNQLKLFDDRGFGFHVSVPSTLLLSTKLRVTGLSTGAYTDIRYFLSATLTYDMRVPGFTRTETSSVRAQTYVIGPRGSSKYARYISMEVYVNSLILIAPVTAKLYPVLQPYGDTTYRGSPQINMRYTLPVTGYTATVAPGVSGDLLWRYIRRYPDYKEPWPYPILEEVTLATYNVSKAFAKVRVVNPVSQGVFLGSGRDIWSMCVAGLYADITLKSNDPLVAPDLRCYLLEPLAYSAPVTRGAHAALSVLCSSTSYTYVKQQSGNWKGLDTEPLYVGRLSVSFVLNRLQNDSYSLYGYFCAEGMDPSPKFLGYTECICACLPVIRNGVVSYKLYVGLTPQAFLLVETELTPTALADRLKACDFSTLGYDPVQDVLTLSTVTYQAHW